MAKTLLVFPSMTILLFLLIQSPLCVLAQASDLPNFEIWPVGTEISQKEYSFIRGEICPSPVPDAGNMTIYTENGEALYPSAVSFSFYGIRPDSTQITIGQHSSSADLCKNRVGANFDMPDAIGNWTIYATATWLSEGEIVSIRSNEVFVLVKPPTFQTLEPELFVTKPEFYSVLDWSPDGRNILVAIRSPNGSILGLMDVDSLEVTRLPVEFGQLVDARFSSSRDAILVIAVGESDLTAINYNIASNNTTVVAEDVTSAVWLTALDGERIVYGKMVNAEGEASGYDLWSVKPDGSDATKLHAFSLDEEGRMWIYDANESDVLMKSSEPREFPITENKIFIFNVETKESSTVMEAGGDGGGPQLLRFSPAGDNILFDDGPGYKTPGGPISIVSADGAWSETLYTGQLKFDSTYSDPTSYAVSPDGRFVAAYMELWSSDSPIITKTELTHPLLEFDSVAAFLMAGGIVGSLIVARQLQSQARKN